MSQRISVRVSNEVFESLCEEAKKYGVRISDVIRDKILPQKYPKIEPPTQTEEQKNEAFFQTANASINPTKETIPHIDFANLETLYLLREFLFERNAQILKRVDDKMEKRFGKERKRIP